MSKYTKKKKVLDNVSDFTQAVFDEMDSLEMKLVFNEQKSTFKPPKETGSWREQQILKAARLFPIGITHTYMYDLKTQRSYQIRSFANTEYVVQSASTPLEWKLSEEQKLILGHVCHKATSLKKRTDRLGQTEDIQVTAWYTSDFPQAFGPKEYFGLPGVVLELHEGVDRISFIAKKITPHPLQKVEFVFPERAQIMSEKEFDAIVTGKSSN